MKTKEEILDFLEKNNCNQELINDVKDGDGYGWIAESYKEHGAEFIELALKQDKAKSGFDVYCIAKGSYVYEEHGKAKKLQITEIKFTYKKLEDDTMELKSDTEIFGIVALKADNFDINGYTITQDTLLRIKDFIANEIRKEITKLTIL